MTMTMTKTATATTTKMATMTATMMATHAARRRLLFLAGAAVSLGALPATSRAQNFPDKPVKMIIPYPAGGGADAWGRMVAGKLEKVLGQPIVFDYKPGASTTIGADAAARAPADGYTVFMIDSTAFAYVPNMRKVNYDPIKSFTPLALLGVGPMLLVANPELPVRNVQDLIAHAKANPGKVTIASAGVGSPHHLIGEIFKNRAGISLTHVPYKGAVQYIADLVGGQVDLAVSTITPALQHIASGRLRPLGVSSARRSSALPEVPSIAEQGLAGFDEKPWSCFVAPAGLEPAVLEKLRAAFRATLEDPEVAGGLRKVGMEDAGAWTVAQISEQMQADLAKWGDVIRAANIRLDS
jgi:tripartite-type tricarboxylate transporter receptor subunit TctC